MLIKVILVVKNSFSSNFPHLSCFFHQTRIFHCSKPCFVPKNLTHPTFTAKRYLNCTVKFAKNKRAFLEGNYLLEVKLRYILDKMWLQKVWLVAVCCFGERKCFIVQNLH